MELSEKQKEIATKAFNSFAPIDVTMTGRMLAACAAVLAATQSSAETQTVSEVKGSPSMIKAAFDAMDKHARDESRVCHCVVASECSLAVGLRAALECNSRQTRPVMKCLSCNTTTDKTPATVAWGPPYPACGVCGAQLVDYVTAQPGEPHFPIDKTDAYEERQDAERQATSLKTCPKCGREQITGKEHFGNCCLAEIVDETQAAEPLVEEEPQCSGPFGDARTCPVHSKDIYKPKKWDLRT